MANLGGMDRLSSEIWRMIQANLIGMALDLVPLRPKNHARIPLGRNAIRAVFRGPKKQAPYSTL